MPKIWSPVILAQLHPRRTLVIDRNYHLDKYYHTIEDLKVKVQGCEAASHGKYVESLIRLQVLALLQQPGYEPDLLRYHDEIKEWLPSHCFDPPMQFKSETGMIVEVEKIACEGELQERTLNVRVHVNYTILATQNEAIMLTEASREEPDPGPAPYHPSLAIMDTIHNLESEVKRLSQDNAALNRRIMLYEKNLLSLKNAVRKAEHRSHSLLSELSQSNRLIQALQERIREKESVIRRESPKASWNISATPEGSRLPLGDKIRQLFASG